MSTRAAAMLGLACAAVLPLRAGSMAIAAQAGLRQAPAASVAADRHDDDARSGGTAGGFLRELLDADAGSSECLPTLGALRQKHGFEMDPALWADRQMKPGSRLITVGDSVIGQMHALGRPGFSCSSARPCTGSAPFRVGENATWDVELSKTDDKYIDKGWQHLRRYMVRSSEGGMSQIEGWEFAPEVSNDISLMGSSVHVLEKHLAEEIVPTEHDVLLIGLLGNHFTNLGAFDRYAELLLKQVVNPWPGRVVVLGTSPQHFKTKGGSYDADVGQTRCGPWPLPSEMEVRVNKNRNDIWGYRVWKHLENKRARVVDMYEMLQPLWRCHRTTKDCTHWQDAVISIQVQLVLEALKKIG